MIISRRRARRLALAVGTILLGTSVRATADDSNQGAEALFQRARERMGQGDFAAACPMLEEAYSLDHGAGTQLALAICHDGAGKPALALREFRESLSVAVRANRPDRVILAESHVQALEASVPRIKVRPPVPEPVGLELTVDGVAVDRAAMEAGIPVDPGEHLVEARAPFAASWRTQVEVGKTPTPVVVVIPALGGTVATAAQPDRVQAPASSTSRKAGWIVGGLAVAAAAVGAGFGVAAFDAEARSRSACQGNLCTPGGVDLNHEARRDAIVSDVTFAVSGVALATAAFLLWAGRAPATVASPSLDLRVGCAAGGADVGVTGSW